MENERRARLLYEAIAQALTSSGMMGVLAAADDARKKKSWADASSKTKDIFLSIEANLTKLEGKR